MSKGTRLSIWIVLAVAILLAAFLAGSFFPFSSEAVMVALMATGLDPWLLMAYGTLGNERIAADGIYNLNGQRVAAPQKGLYIVNGKKYITK